MSLLADFNAAMSSKLPFKLAWKRARCLRYNHAGREWESIERKTYEKHPANDADLVYAVNLFRCKHCGLIGTDAGFELREPLD